MSSLAVRVAITAAATAAVAGTLLGVVGAPPAAAGLGAALAGGAAAYFAVRRRVTRRLADARVALGDAGAGISDGYPGAAGSDEIDALASDAARAGRALRQEVARLERLADYRRSFLGDVSHELRTPIFAISGFAESLLDGALDDPSVRRRFVEKILANARRLDALARDVAEIARIESGELRMRSEELDVGPLARETVEALEPLAAERGVSLEARVPDALPRVLGDRARLQQVLANLVENAVKYTERGGHVKLTAAAGAAGVSISVADDGIGIAPEDVPRVTERFFRVDRSRARSEGGTGLGLSIVKHILEAHGGRLEVESRLGEGSTFAFTLPLEGAGSPRGAALARSPAASPAPTSG